MLSCFVFGLGFELETETALRRAMGDGLDPPEGDRG